MHSFDNPFADLYIPTIDDIDNINNGKLTVEELYTRVEQHKQVEQQKITAIVVDTESVGSDPASVGSDSPINREVLYYERGSKDKLKAVCEPNEVLVSRDTNDKGAKAYKIVALDKWLKTTSKFDTNEYECLRGAVYPYMDIESEKESINVMDMLNHSIGLFIDALQNAGLTVNGVAISNSSRPGKHSFHAVIHTDKVFESTLTLKEFVITQVKPNFYNGVTDEIRESISWSKMDKKTNLIKTMECVDWLVYTTDRVIRFLNQSKIGKKVRLTPYTNSDIILPCPFLTAPADYLIGQYGQSSAKPIFIVELPESVKKLKEAKEAGLITPQVKLDVTYLSELASMISDEIIQSGTTCCSFIWAMTRCGASRDLIHNNCKRTDNYDEAWVDYHIKLSETKPAGIGSLRYWASQNNKKGFHELSKKYMIQELINEIHTFQTVIPIEQYSERYLRPFTFEGVDTLLIKSHLGTGKTTQIMNLIKPQKQFLERDFVPFARIMIVSPRKSFTKFICGDLEDSKLGFKSYDDKHNCPLSTIDRLVISPESLWRLEDGFAKYDLVICDESESILHQFYSDATHRHNMKANHTMFERCISTATKVCFADAFLMNRTIKLAESLRNVEHAKVIENTYCPYERNAIQLKSIKKGKEFPSVSEFCNRLMGDLKKGEKIAVIWGSKNKAKAFAENFLKDSTYNWKLYTSESSPEERNDLLNVEEAWKNVDIINYTSTITVGVNYDPADEAVQFDKIYLYASASGGLPRDVAQALLRCRKIKSNTLIYTVDKNALQTALYGRETIRCAIADKKRTILQKNPVATWENAPKWAEENYIQNENENGAKCIAFNNILNVYLEKSGYKITEEIVVEDGSVELNVEGVSYEDIADVEEEIVESIKRKSKAGFATYDEKLILQKHRFRNQLVTDDMKILSVLWAEYMMNKGNEFAFWNLVGEKHQTTDEYLAFESSQKYIQQSSKKCLKRIVMDKLLPILTVKNSADEFNITVSDEMVKQLKGIEEEVFRAFQKDDSRRKGEFTASNAVDMIKMVYKSWSINEIKSTSTKKQVKGIRKNVFTITKAKNSLWDLITQRTNKASD
jgi:hypothetical protein